MNEKKFVEAPVHFSPEVEDRAWKLASRRIKRGGLRIRMKNTPEENRRFDEAMTRALSTLREVSQRLAQGVNKARFEKEYRGRFVSPGISVRRHIEELRMAGSLEETNSRMKLKSKNMAVSA